MRTVLVILGSVMLALAIGFVSQVMLRQGREVGTFIQRFETVALRQLALAPAEVQESPTVGGRSDAADENGRAGSSLPPDVEEAVRVAALSIAEVNRQEFAKLKHDLNEQELNRDSDSFWTGVQLNAVFTLVGFGLPIFFRRFGWLL